MMRLSAVSYTHLDVYKRQILDTMKKEGTYIRPWVEEKLRALGVEYTDYMDYTKC